VASQGGNAAIERMRQMVSDDPNMIGQVMRPQPVFAGGKMRGFRVYPGANRQAFARIGLRAGDLVTAINGTPLDDKDRAQEIFSTLNSSADARVTVTRNGRQQELVLNIAQIASEAEQLGNPGDGMIPQDPAPEPAPGNE
jgi:general secretion pathway protein C